MSMITSTMMEHTTENEGAPDQGGGSGLGLIQHKP